MLIDTHVHLNDKRFEEDKEQIIQNFEKDNIEKVITIGYNFSSSKEAFLLAKEHTRVYAALGIHPKDATNYSKEFENFALKAAEFKKVVAIGEIGLDYFNNAIPATLQKEVFIKQLSLASNLGLPVIIHCRDAYEEVLKILQENKHLLKCGGVMHCYGGSLPLAKSFLELGFYIGFGGPITFKNSKLATEVVAYLPKDKILIETDCPYLAPHPYRGTRNEPKYVSKVAQKMAEVFNVSYEEIAKITGENAKRLFFRLR